MTSVEPGSTDAGIRSLSELVVCSLEPWDDIWRRNQFLVDELLRSHAELRVLFVEPPADPLFDLAQMRRPEGPRFRSLRGDGRLRALRPLKPLPRRFGRFSDQWLRHQLLAAVRRLGFMHPTLWLNDVTYAPLIARTGWPSVYDVTDDWLVAGFSPGETERLRVLEAAALEQAHEVVVCSAALAVSRGRARAVTLVPNAVDIDHFRRPRPRPADLPSTQTAVYVGTLHESRLDVDLVIEIARTLPTLAVVLVGPDSLEVGSRRRLAAELNVHLLGSRPYFEVPAYLQHADVVIVPHRITPFTDSLDPIKAYECLAVGKPTVATPVAGFRELQATFSVVDRRVFPETVGTMLMHRPTTRSRLHNNILTWTETSRAFGEILQRAAEGAR